MSKAETIIMTAIKQELQDEIHNAVTDAFREGLCTAAKMVRVCATNDFLKKQLRDRPEITLKAIAHAIEATSPEPPGGTP
jgi:fructose 1,6-bisphosphatase